MFPQGLADQVITVTTQPAAVEMTHDILGAEGIERKNLKKYIS